MHTEQSYNTLESRLRATEKASHAVHTALQAYPDVFPEYDPDNHKSAWVFFGEEL